MKNLYLICLLFIISACGTPTTEDRITFTQVDPFLKVFRESNFFPEYDETEEVYNPQIQISAESETKRSIFREKDKTKRSKKESAQHSKSRNKSFVMTSVSAL